MKMVSRVFCRYSLRWLLLISILSVCVSCLMLSVAYANEEAINSTRQVGSSSNELKVSDNPAMSEHASENGADDAREGGSTAEDDANLEANRSYGETDLSVTTFATGWVEQGEYWFYYESGSPATGSRFLGNKWYRFDLSDGHMLTGWQEIDGKWYYYDPSSGAMSFQNRCIAGKWYWFDMQAGFMWTGAANIYGDWYWYDLTDGHMLTGSQNIYGNWYWYDPIDGKMHFGWQEIDGKWYYYDPSSGAMSFQNRCIAGKWYWFDMQAGFMWTGAASIYGDWYWYDLTDGHMLTGSQNIYGNWYWYDPIDGKMHFGWQEIDGKWYFYALDTGRMFLGYQNIYGARLHFDENTGYLINGSVSVYPYSLDQAVSAQMLLLPTYDKNQYEEAMLPNYDSQSPNYQFMRLDGGYSGITASQIDAYVIKNCIYQEQVTGRISSLRGIGETIVQVSKETGVNEVYILAHAIVESGWGCSNLSTGSVAGYEGYYNFFGISAFDVDPENAGAAYAKNMGWTTPSEAMAGGVRWIKNNYISREIDTGLGSMTSQNTLYKMRFAPGLSNVQHQYATDIKWAQTISSVISGIYEYCGEGKITYEIPLYSD